MSSNIHNSSVQRAPLLSNSQNFNQSQQEELSERAQIPCDIKYTEGFSPKKMKQLVDQLRFKQKMQVINRKKGRYKRSTNNCHKKYIGILKNLLFLKLNEQIRNELLEFYSQYRNSRVYYFIILSYLMWHINPNDIRSVFKQFCRQVEGKISRYKLQSSMTNNLNFVHFRKDEIIEMEYSLQSINLFLRGRIQQAVKVLYQKNKYIIIKKNQHQRTLQIIQNLDQKFRAQFAHIDILQKISSLNLQEAHQWRKDSLFDDLQVKDQAMTQKRKKESQQQSYKYKQENKLSYRWESKKEIKSNVMIKQQERSQPIINFQPLLHLEHSYPIMDSITWHRWLVHKQETFNSYFKQFQALQVNYQQQSSSFRINSQIPYNQSFSRATP